ncbi:MAG: NACHT domain-containing protein, partial [bacterium]|nr:NACHT domain-containing protein [bacterium]
MKKTLSLFCTCFALLIVLVLLVPLLHAQKSSTGKKADVKEPSKTTAPVTIPDDKDAVDEGLIVKGTKNKNVKDNGSNKKTGDHSGDKERDWLDYLGYLVGLIGLLAALYQRLKRSKDKIDDLHIENEVKQEIDNKEQAKKSGDEKSLYCIQLRDELNSLGLTGPQFEGKHLDLDKSFVSLRLSQTLRPEPTQKNGRKETVPQQEETVLTPGQVLEKAFPEHPLLFILGTSGSGKTTLMKHYALNLLDNNHPGLGPVLPLYIPLRELNLSKEALPTLPESLANWSALQHQPIDPGIVKGWLQDDKTLVLLDGLDEISDLDKRLKVCAWIESAVGTFEKAYFILTSRRTGFRKRDRFILKCKHLRVKILDFNTKQQELFLNKWFHAVYLDELGHGAEENQIRQKEEAQQLARSIINFLKNEKNKSVRELARVPMMLQIMAILWKERKYLPGSRSKLYDISLNYLLEYRDLERGLVPVLPSEEARMVLEPTALWLQKSLESDNAPKVDIHNVMKHYLDDMHGTTTAKDLCENLRDRAGLIADYGDGYIFRHKSFMEYLAALQMLKECRDNSESFLFLVANFNKPGWVETLKFFFCKADGIVFNRFMAAFFQSQGSKEFDVNKATLLQSLVSEAPQRKTDAMVQCLNSDESNENQKRYILNCLKIINTVESIGAVNAFCEKDREDEAAPLAREIILEMGKKHGFELERPIKAETPESAPLFFNNAQEDNFEYIKIPGGSFRFRLTGQIESVPEMYF